MIEYYNNLTNIQICLLIVKRGIAIFLFLDRISQFCNFFFLDAAVLQIYSFLEKIMGNRLQVNFEQSPNPITNIKQSCNRSKKTHQRNNLSSVSSHFRSPSISQLKSIRLSQLRGKLNSRQCFYTLSTLIQQYYSLFRFYKKVVVSDNLCLVNQLGEINVDFCIDGPDTALSSYNQVTHSFITVISQIITLVEKLAFDSNSLESGEVQIFMEQLITKIHNNHQNDQVIYNEVVQLFNSFLQTNNIKCNLIDAYLRYWKYATIQQKGVSSNQEETPYLANSRITQKYRNSLVQKVISDSDHQYEPSLRRKDNTSTRQSHMGNRNCLAFNKNPSKYSHKMVKTEGQSYFVEMMSKRNQNINPSTFYQESFNTRFTKNGINKISHQYTLNILNYKGQAHGEKRNQRGAKENKVRGQNKRQTSLSKLAEIKFDQKSQAGKSCAKSMLQQLARSVSIRDEPTSRDYIN